MVIKKFPLVIVSKLISIMLTLMALCYFFILPGYYAMTLIIAILLLSQCIFIYRFIVKTNTELTRFLDAARNSDFSQHFEFNQLGAGFEELGQTLTDILQQFQVNRAKQAEELSHYKAIIEHSPVPLISIHAQGKVILWNKSARRLFGSTPVHLTSDLKQFGEEFFQYICALRVDERRLVSFNVDDMEQQLTISATQITIAGKQETLISMQNIQNELDDTQLQAWQDLSHVLTHEIMNSITPVTSLAKTAGVLLNNMNNKLDNINELGQEELTELRAELPKVTNAVQTVARRSDGLMEFIGNYRRLTNLPRLNKQTVKIADLFKQVSSIATQHWPVKDIQFQSQVTPLLLNISIDINMVEQILINLLQNSEQAVENIAKPQVSLQAFLNKRGHIVIEVADNGIGVPRDIEKQIFLPFFTTKHTGSGIGLALTRQVMIAHGGMVKLEHSALGGALFRLTF